MDLREELSSTRRVGEEKKEDTGCRSRGPPSVACLGSNTPKNLWESGPTPVGRGDVVVSRVDVEGGRKSSGPPPGTPDIESALESRVRPPEESFVSISPDRRSSRVSSSRS